MSSDDPKDRRPDSACAAGRERAGHHAIACAFADLQLDAARRALLGDLAFWAEQGMDVAPHRVRDLQALESMGLCRIDWQRLAHSPWGDYGGIAAITPAGWRLINGPRLATFRGHPLDIDTPASWGVAQALRQVFYNDVCEQERK